jgi:hypothetical protein
MVAAFDRASAIQAIAQLLDRFTDEISDLVVGLHLDDCCGHGDTVPRRSG